MRQFLTYFFRYWLALKSGRSLFLLAFLGIFLSSAALLVLQCVMKGLQHNLIERSQSVEGVGEFILEGEEQSLPYVEKLMDELTKAGVEAYPEVSMELLAKRGEYFVPLSLHGLSERFGHPHFLATTKLKNVALGVDVLARLHDPLYSNITLVAPTFVDALFGEEIPRSVDVQVDEVVMSNVPEIDAFHGWVRAEILHQLMHKISYNRIRLYSPLPKDLKIKAKWLSWEKKHDSLVLALNLEQGMMVCLFAFMSVLVGISINAGLLIFFNKVKKDLLAFWVLGASIQYIKRGMLFFIQFMSVSAIAGGIGLATLLLSMLQHFSPTIMPAVFVEQQIPVYFHFMAYVVSFTIPYVVSTLFSLSALKRVDPSQTALLQVLRTRI